MLLETDVVTAVEDATIDPEIPQTSADSKFLRIHTRTRTGELDLRVSIGAAPRLAEAIMTQTNAVEFAATEIGVNLSTDGGSAILTVVNPKQALSVKIPRGGLEAFQNRISHLLSP